MTDQQVSTQFKSRAAAIDEPKRSSQQSHHQFNHYNKHYYKIESEPFLCISTSECFHHFLQDHKKQNLIFIVNFTRLEDKKKQDNTSIYLVHINSVKWIHFLLTSSMVSVPSSHSIHFLSLFVLLTRGVVGVSW